MASHRVTTAHIRYLAAGPARAGGQRGTALVDTDDGIRLVPAAEVLASGVRRLLLTRTDLAEDAAAAGRTVSEHVRAEGGRYAAELNTLIAENT